MAMDVYKSDEIVCDDIINKKVKMSFPTKKMNEEISELKAKYDKDTHTLQNQLDVANADLYECNNIISDYIDTVEEKDKIIDLMAKAIDNYDSQLVINTFKNKEHVKQYFEKKVREEYEKNNSI